MRKIALIEDSQQVQAIVNSIFSSKFDVLIAETKSEAIKLLNSNTVDIILMDVILPDCDGFSLFTEIKTQPNTFATPVIFLTGRNSLQDKITGFSLGAEDYISKPFDPLELKLRVESRLNKLREQKESDEKLLLFDLILNISQQKLYRIVGTVQKPIDLTPSEFKILSYFAKNAGRILTRNNILDAVWGASTHVTDRTVDKYVSSLRKKVETPDLIIKAIHGIGYQLIKD